MRHGTRRGRFQERLVDWQTCSAYSRCERASLSSSNRPLFNYQRKRGSNESLNKKRPKVGSTNSADQVMENIQSIIEKQKQYDAVDGPDYARKKIRDIDQVKTTLRKINDGQLEKYKLQQQQHEDSAFLDSLSFDSLKTRFIYPFCVEQGFASGRGRSRVDVVDDPQFSFQTQVETKPEALEELRRPLTFTMDQLDDDLTKLSAQLATKLMPQVTANSEFARDILSEDEYKGLALPRRKTPTRTVKSILPEHFLQPRTPMTPPSSLGHYANAEEMLSPEQAGKWLQAQNRALQRWQLLNPQAVNVTLPRSQITECLELIQGAAIKRLVGLLAHFAYWKLFSHMNPLPIDKFHLKQLFVAIASSFAQIQLIFRGGPQKRKLYSHFYMPTLLLTVRVQVAKLFYEGFPLFSKRNSQRLLKKLNDLISQILDPNQFLSRFSLLESRKDAIAVRDRLQKTRLAGTTLRNAFYTRSALLRSVIPQPADGKVRVLFGTSQLSLPPPPRSQPAEPVAPSTFRNKRLSPDRGTFTFSQLSPYNPQAFQKSHSPLKEPSQRMQQTGGFQQQYNSIQTTSLPFSSSRIETDLQDSKIANARSLFRSADQTGDEEGLTAYFDGTQEEEDPQMELLNRIQLLQIAQDKLQPQKKT